MSSLFGGEVEPEAEILADIWVKDPLCADFYKDLRKVPFTIEDAGSLARMAITQGTDKVKADLKILDGSVEEPYHSSLHPLHKPESDVTQYTPLSSAINRTLNEEY